jgi:hypothetical protein
MARALVELQLLPSPVPVSLISEIALWYADTLEQLGTLPRDAEAEAEGGRRTYH